MPALVLLRRQLLIASDDVPLFALPAALFHSAWAIVLIVTLALYQRHPVCRDEGDYLPFLAGGAGAFTVSSVLEWSLFRVGLIGTPLETHARRAVPTLLYLHTIASVAELGFASYGVHLLHVDTRLCTAWSPRPMAAALVGTTWAVIALNGLLTVLALNPWHGLGLVEAWEARLLWLARLLCCRSRILTHARMPDREPALRRIAQLTSHLLMHVDLTLSDVATAMILVAAAQRERRRRALRDAMVAAAAAHAALLAPGPSGSAAAAAAALSVLPQGLPSLACVSAAIPSFASSGKGAGAAGKAQPAGGAALTAARGAPTGASLGAAPTRGSRGSLQGSGNSGVSSEMGAGAAEQSGTLGWEEGPLPGGGMSPFLAVQHPGGQHPGGQPHTPIPPALPAQTQTQAQAHPPPRPQPPRQPQLGRNSKGAHEEDGTELAPVPGPAAPSPSPPPPPVAGFPSPPDSGGLPTPFLSSPPHVNPLLASSWATPHGGDGAVNSGGAATGSPGRSAAPWPGQSSSGSITTSPLGEALGPHEVAALALAEEPLLPSPGHVHPMVYITPAGMEEHLDELVGELVGELAAEAAEADVEAGETREGGLLSATTGSTDLDLNVDLDLQHLKLEGPDSEEPGAVRLRSVQSAAQEAAVAAVAAAAAAAAAVAKADGGAAAATGSRSTGQATALVGTASPPPAPQSAATLAALRKRIGDAALAAAFAAEREMVDRDTLREAAVYGRYAAAIYGSCPPDGPSKSSSWHLGGDGDAASPDEVAAWRRRHGSSAPDPLLASILSSASQCTEHVIHVNTHNSTEGYLPYMVCLDKPTRSVVIAIRGTFSAEDIVTDCLCEPFDVRHMLSPDGTAVTPPPRPSGAPEGVQGAAPPGDSLEALRALRAEAANGDAGAAAAVAAAASAGSATGRGGGDDPVLVHAGIWAAADVIWEDLRYLRLLEILLTPPGEQQAAAQPPATTISITSTSTTAVTPAFASPVRDTAPPAGPTGAAELPRPTPPARSGTSTSSTSPPSLAPTEAPQGPRREDLQLHPQLQPQVRERLQPQPRAQQRMPSPQPQLNRPRQPAPPPRWRPASLDEDRPVAPAGGPGSHLAAPPPALDAAGASLSDVSRQPSSHAAGHLPRLVSAERQATLPQGSGLSALLLRSPLLLRGPRRLPAPPPLPAAALLPSLALSYQPPPRMSSFPADGAGAPPARFRREFLAAALRRGKSPTAAAASSGRRRRHSGGGSGSFGGGSAGESSGEGRGDDNDPTAPLLLSPHPAAAGTIGYSPAATTLLASRAVSAASAAAMGTRPPPRRAATPPPLASMGPGRNPPGGPYRPERSFAGGGRRDGVGTWTGVVVGAPAGTSPSRLVHATSGTVSGRHATGNGTGSGNGVVPGSSSSRPSPPPRPVPAAQLRPLAALPRPPLQGAGGGGGGGSDATAPVSRAAGCPGAADGAPGRAVSPGLLGWVRQIASGVWSGVSGRSGRQQLQPQAQEHPQQPQPQPPLPAQRLHSRMGWFVTAPRAASEGGATLPYMSLPRTEAEAEREAAGGGAGGDGGPATAVVGDSFDMVLGRRWRSLGGGGNRGGSGVDGGVVDGWLVGPAPPRHHLTSLDVEAPAPAPAGSEGSEEDPPASGQHLRPSTAVEGSGNSGCGGGGSAPLQLPEVDCTGWRLVVTGHSLGAGAAALLALRLRSALPHVDVRCWAFSPPGSLTSPSLSEALRPFTVSVVTGKDLIPRLSLNTMERYRDEMITALARCRCSKARVLVGSFSRRNRLRRAAHLLVPYDQVPDQARRLLRVYHEAVLRAGRLPELHPPGRILYLQPSARSADRSKEVGLRGRDSAERGGGPSPSPHFRPVWVSARELLSEGILASTRMLVDHSLTLCTLPALDEILSS